MQVIDPPRISVVIPAFNYAQYLGDALESVLAQTVDDWECVILDDGSTDDTPDVAARFVARDPRIRYVRQENRGLAAARNAGTRHATGMYVQYLDADDRLEPSKLSFHARFLDEHSDADVVYGYTTFFRTEQPDDVLYGLNGKLSRPLLATVTNGAEALERLQMFNIMPVPSAIIRRAVWERVGGFNEKMRSVEDWDFWLRAAIAGCEFRFSDAEGARARVRIHSSSMSRSSERMLRGLIEGSRTFGDTRAAALWRKTSLPLIYEMAAGVDDATHGRRLQGSRRMLHAVRGATSPITRARWTAYAAAALLLPRFAFWWVVTRPMPERGLELLRRLRRSRSA